MTDLTSSSLGKLPAELRTRLYQKLAEDAFVLVRAAEYHSAPNPPYNPQTQFSYYQSVAFSACINFTCTCKAIRQEAMEVFRNYMRLAIISQEDTQLSMHRVPRGIREVIHSVEFLKYEGVFDRQFLTPLVNLKHVYFGMWSSDSLGRDDDWEDESVRSRKRKEMISEDGLEEILEESRVLQHDDHDESGRYIVQHPDRPFEATVEHLWRNDSRLGVKGSSMQLVSFDLPRSAC